MHQSKTPESHATTKPDGTHWHTLTFEQTSRELDVAGTGLTEAEAQSRREKFGPNTFELEKSSGFLSRLAAQLHNLLIYVLLVASLITFAIGHYLDSGVILAVVVLNVVIGLYQEGKAEKSLQAIKKMLAPKAQVLRDGVLKTMPADDLVPGDIILVASGDNLAADVRFSSTVNLQVDESALTGESVPVTKITEPVDKQATIGDRFCMGYAGTLVTQGQGKAIVVRTGMSTEMGRIGKMLRSVQSIKTPLMESMERFSRWLTFAILTFALLLFAYGYWFIGFSAAEIFMAVVGLAVAAIPEGLPAILTITLAIGVQRMANRRAVIRRLPAVETLGSVTVICSDKTGTLTRNEMTVQAVTTAEGRFTVSGIGYAPEGEVCDSSDTQKHYPYTEVSDNPRVAPLQLIGLTSALCNDSSLTQSDANQWQLAGDPTEGALLTLAIKLGAQPKSLHTDLPRVAAVPFESDHRYMATAHAVKDNKSTIILVKGAPEKLLDLATEQYASDGSLVSLDKAYWLSEIETQAHLGRRVLGFAVKLCTNAVDQKTISQEINGLAFIGIAGIIDPPREEAIAAIDLCKHAGIRVKMITGDHAVTASAIATELGIGDGKSVLTGVDIQEMSDEALQSAVKTVDVFARASPEHKLRLVKALQTNREVVAMTGDGVNDAPALKQADIGIAMGQKGTEAAKQAAEIVLADDNFASIVNAVEEGRTVYDNLKKTIAFLLPINGGESMAIGAAILIGIALPITPLQILWVNMVSSVGLAMVLAFEPPEPGIMNRKPRDRNSPLLSYFLVWRIVFVSSLFLIGIFGVYHWTLSAGGSVEQARTMAVNALVSMEVFYLFSVRYLKSPSFTWVGVRGTRTVLSAVALVVALQLLFSYFPPLQTLFATEALSFWQLISIALVGLAVLVVLEIEKWLVRRTGNSIEI
jgi:magnesium-transporting ATPase (P-type)